MFRTRIVRRWVSPIALCGALGVASVAATPACTAAQWQSFVNSSTQFVTYVEAFLSTAQEVWSIVQPLIKDPATSASATAAYNDAVLSINAALATYQDAIKAADSTSQDSTNLAPLEAAVQAAVTNLASVLAKWQPLGATADAGASGATPFATLAHRAAVIATWK